MNPRYLARCPARRRRPARPGNSLLELVAAATIIATTLVPALQIMGESLRISGDVETGALMTTVCVSRLEEEMARSAAAWDLTDTSGNYAALGHADVKYSVVKGDTVAEGGIPDALMAIIVTVWQDRDGDDLRDASEPSVIYGTKISKLRNYQDTASD